MIVVTGATGQLGSLIVENLICRYPSEKIGISVRDPSKAAHLADRGVRVRHGDYASPETLAHAFQDATQVLIVSSGAQATGGNSISHHHNAINAAQAAGARRIVYTSHMAASSNSLFSPMVTHAATEELLAACGSPWTSLRNGFYASRALQEVTTALKSRTIAAPADGKISWTAHANLAEAAAIVLAEEGRFDGPTPPLTGSEALDFQDIASMMTDLLDQEIIRAHISDEELEAGIAARGLHPAVIEIATGFYAAARGGEFARVDPTLKQLIGKDPIQLRSLIAQTIVVGGDQ